MEDRIGDSIRQGQESRSQLSKNIKQLSIALASTGLLVATWWVLKESILGGHHPSYWIWPVAAMVLWVTMVSFFALINPDRITFFIFNVIGLISFLVIMPKNIYFFAGGAVFFLLSLLFQRRLQDEEKNQLNFSIRRTVGNAQPVITYAFLVLLGFMIYANVSEDFARDPNQFYKRLGETAVKGVPYLSQDSSRYNLSQTMEQFFRKQAEEQYPEFNEVSATQQRVWLEQMQVNFRQQFGVSANENATLRVALTEVVTERMRESLGKFEKFFPLIFTVLIVALMRTFAFVFNWLVLFVTWLFFKLLLLVRFFRIEKETVEVEKLEI
jgi:hypothetical protein